MLSEYIYPSAIYKFLLLRSLDGPLSSPLCHFGSHEVLLRRGWGGRGGEGEGGREGEGRGKGARWLEKIWKINTPWMGNIYIAVGTLPATSQGKFMKTALTFPDKGLFLNSHGKNLTFSSGQDLVLSWLQLFNY